jgi:arylsulfatase A-like enzyme/Tfp pilus assembly protein PilF
MLVTAALVVASIATGFWWSTRTTPVGPIILISIDTLRADRLPAYGYTAGRTPAIDALATDGVLFEHAYTHSPQTLPAHTSILSGRLPFEHGVRDNVGFTVKGDEILLPQRLHDLGYATGAFVSSYVLRKQVGLTRGFDMYDDALPAAAPNRPLGQVQRPGAQTTDAAIAWLQQQTSDKLFLFLHLYEPHTPYAPPPEFAGGNLYDGEVAYADTLVAHLISTLKTSGRYDNATIILLSDHGEGLGDHGEDEHGMFLYRETIQVPLIVKLPAGASGGRRVAEPVQHIDLVPTLMDLVGHPTQGTFRGRSLRPALMGDGALPTTGIYAETLSPRLHFGWSELYALTDDRYRFIRAPRDELYDLSTDPGELTSVIDTRAPVRAAMRQTLDAMIAGATIAAPSTVSDADRQRLAALGYVGTQRSASLSTPGDALPDPKDKRVVLQQYRRAAGFAAEGRWREATEGFRDVLRTDADMPDVWLQLAGAYDVMGQPAEALKAYREVVARHPGDAAGLMGAAASYVQLGQFDQARAHAELAVASAPAAAHELLARIALQQGDVARARQHAAAGVAADPTLPLPDIIEGLIFYNQGRFADAVGPLTRATRALSSRTEQVADVYYVLGDALARTERFAEAEAAFKQELSTFPKHLRARAGLAMMYGTTNRQSAAAAVIVELETMAARDQVPGARDLAQQLRTLLKLH